MTPASDEHQLILRLPWRRGPGFGSVLVRSQATEHGGSVELHQGVEMLSLSQSGILHLKVA